MKDTSSPQVESCLSGSTMCFDVNVYLSHIHMGKMTHGMTLPLIFNSLSKTVSDTHYNHRVRIAIVKRVTGQQQLLYKNIVTDNSKVSNIEVLRIC